MGLQCGSRDSSRTRAEPLQRLAVDLKVTRVRWSPASAAGYCVPWPPVRLPKTIDTLHIIGLLGYPPI
jgi:hypothetical protein